MPIVNLTPHPIRVYPPDVPDMFDPINPIWEPRMIIEASGTVARIAEVVQWQRPMTQYPVEVESIKYGQITGLPPKSVRLGVEKTWFVVALPLALMLAGSRSDLLVPRRQVRTLDGTVFGCRTLARVHL